MADLEPGPLGGLGARVGRDVPLRIDDGELSPVFGPVRRARIGVAFPACWADCSEAVASTRADLVWAESKDEGMTWYADQVLGSATVSSRRVNSYPSVVWYGSTRAVSWVGEAITSGYVYRVYLRTGIGAP